MLLPKHEGQMLQRESLTIAMPQRWESWSFQAREETKLALELQGESKSFEVGKREGGSQVLDGLVNLEKDLVF